MSREKQSVAIVHHLCPICAKQDKGGILIHMRIGDLSQVHNQNVGWEVCNDCKQAIDNGAIMLIVVDESRSGEDLNDPSQWYRCGHVFGVREEYIRRVFSSKELVDDIVKRRSAVLEVNTAEQLGFDVSKYREHEKSLQHETKA